MSLHREVKRGLCLLRCRSSSRRARRCPRWRRWRCARAARTAACGPRCRALRACAASRSPRRCPWTPRAARPPCWCASGVGSVGGGAARWSRIHPCSSAQRGVSGPSEAYPIGLRPCLGRSRVDAQAAAGHSGRAAQPWPRLPHRCDPSARAGGAALRRADQPAAGRRGRQRDDRQPEPPAGRIQGARGAPLAAPTRAPADEQACCVTVMRALCHGCPAGLHYRAGTKASRKGSARHAAGPQHVPVRSRAALGMLGSAVRMEVRDAHSFAHAQPAAASPGQQPCPAMTSCPWPAAEPAARE